MTPSRWNQKRSSKHLISKALNKSMLSTMTTLSPVSGEVLDNNTLPWPLLQLRLPFVCFWNLVELLVVVTCCCVMNYVKVKDALTLFTFIFTLRPNNRQQNASVRSTMNQWKLWWVFQSDKELLNLFEHVASHKWAREWVLRGSMVNLN